MGIPNLYRNPACISYRFSGVFDPNPYEKETNKADIKGIALPVPYITVLPI